jgi:hypothetical protein
MLRLRENGFFKKHTELHVSVNKQLLLVAGFAIRRNGYSAFLSPSGSNVPVEPKATYGVHHGPNNDQRRFALDLCVRGRRL